MRKFRNLVVKKLAQGQIVGKNMLGIDPELLILNDQALLLKRSYILKNIALFFLILVLTHAECMFFCSCSKRGLIPTHPFLS